MTTLFNRQVELIIGRVGETGRTYRDLKIEFDIDKSRESNANSGQIGIYNLNNASRKLINEEGAQYILKAGYAPAGEAPLVKLLSSGDILDIETTRMGADIVTKFKIGEATKALREKTLDKSYKEGTLVDKVLGDLTDALGVAKSTIKGVQDLVFNSGYSSSGKAKDRLDEITEKLGLEWNVQNGELQVFPKDGSTDESIIFLSKDTGLLKAYPVKVETQGAQGLKDALRFEALLNPDIKVGRRIQLVSSVSETNQVVTVRKLKYSGDNKDGRFICSGDAS